MSAVQDTELYISEKIKRHSAPYVCTSILDVLEHYRAPIYDKLVWFYDHVIFKRLNQSRAQIDSKYVYVWR